MITIISTQKTNLLKVLLLLLFTCLALTFLVTQAQAAVVLDVTPSGGAYNSIQDAINAAPITTDTVKIRVAQGRYQQSIIILQAKDLTIEGGWNSAFTNRNTSRATIVNANDLASAIIVGSNSTAEIDGLTATHGSNSGLWVDDSTMTVRNSKIGRNHSSSGGGIHSTNSTLLIEDSLISENSIVIAAAPIETDSTVGGILANGFGSGGGGIYAYNTYLTVRNSTIRDNYDNAGSIIANSGGGIYLNLSEAVIEDSRILNNLAMANFGPANGGGIYSAASDLTIRNSIVAGNYANYEGGGLYFNNETGQTQIDPPSLLLGARPYGVNDSKPDNLTIINSTFANNAADDDFLPIFAFTGLTRSSINGEDNIGILGSLDGGGGGGARIMTGPDTSTISILNSIFWGNRDDTGTAPYSKTNDLHFSLDASTTLNVSYSDIGVATGDPYSGPGNISVDPLFVDSNDNHLYDASTASYHLKKFSPAIDSGTGVGAPAADIDGVSRPMGAGIDMGAYEEPCNFDTTAPTLKINTPAYSITQSKTNKFRVKWSGSDPESSCGPLKYRIWVRRGNNKIWRLWQDWTQRTSRVFNGRRRKTFYFKGKAKDGAGNVSGFTKEWSTIVPADGIRTDSGITKKRGFRFIKGTSTFKRNYYKSVLRSTKKGSFVTYRFKTTQFTIWATKGRRNGKAKVYINGRFSKTINTNARKGKHRVMVYKKNFGKSKYHTIKIVNIGRRNKKRLDIDGLGARLP